MLYLLHKLGVRIVAQIDDLSAALAADSSKVDAVAAAVGGLGSEVATLKAMLVAAQAANPAVDLTGVLAAATSIGTKLDAVVAAAAAVPPAA